MVNVNWVVEILKALQIIKFTAAAAAPVLLTIANTWGVDEKAFENKV